MDRMLLKIINASFLDFKQKMPHNNEKQDAKHDRFKPTIDRLFSFLSSGHGQKQTIYIDFSPNSNL